MRMTWISYFNDICHLFSYIKDKDIKIVLINGFSVVCLLPIFITWYSSCYMKLSTIIWNDCETACLYLSGGLFPLPLLNRHYGHDWPAGLDQLITTGQIAALGKWYREEGEKRLFDEKIDNFLIPAASVEYAPLYRNPGKIWGVGLNYAGHARDLSAPMPDKFPASFMKPSTTLNGHGGYIKIPVISNKTTAEAELGVIIGKKARNLKPDQTSDVIAGYTCVIDVTAEDILRKNPRYLTLSKSFDTFFSFGPCLISSNEVPDLSLLEVSTVINGKVHASNRVSAMRFSPAELVAFHSGVMTLMPGDIISTGTPGAVEINEGDVVECHISGFPSLVNRVFDLKKSR